MVQIFITDASIRFSEPSYTVYEDVGTLSVCLETVALAEPLMSSVWANVISKNWTAFSEFSCDYVYFIS